MIKFWHRNTTAFFRSSVEQSCNGSFSSVKFHKHPRLCLVPGRPQENKTYNHKNYNFLACDWFKNVLFSTNSLAKLLSDSLLSDSLIGQSHSKMQFKSTNHIQSCNYLCERARCCFCVFALDLRDVYAYFVSILMRIFPFFHNFAIFLFLGNCDFYD